MPSFLEKLNPKQREAAETILGPVLVLAGAGSGKTRALTYRIANMIKEKINPENILAVTFTNKAAQEMRERVDSLIFGENQNPKTSARTFYRRPNFPLIGTFHFFCLMVLREDIEKIGMKRNFAIADESDQLSLVRRIIKDQGLNTERLNPKAVLSKISGSKNDLISPQSFSSQIENYFDEQVASVYPIYQKELQENNLVDFDDIINYTLRIWQENDQILEKYRDRFPFVLVDEYQDTNDAQYQIIKLLASKSKNLFAVGDDYQSIYAWRGANIKNILNFEKDYPRAKIILLEQNYRSTQNILSAAQNIIDKNTNQKPKKLWTENAPGSSIVSYEAADEEDEAEFIVDEITKRARGNYPDFAVLYRINSQSRVIEEQFLKKNIPYRIVGGIKFYQRAEIKDMISYLRLVANFNDYISLARIINVPRRLIGKATLEKLIAFTRETGGNFVEAIKNANEKPGSSPFPLAKLKQLSNFSNLIEEIKEKSTVLPLKELIVLILEKSGYKKYLLDGSEEGQTSFENVLELLSVAEKYKELKPGEAFEKFLEEVTLAGSEENPEKSHNVVTLMTLHAAKGLEFKYVFIPGAEEGLLPHSRSIDSPSEKEEERRLCYVGITRAKEKLWLIHTRSRRLFGQTVSSCPSSFINDIPENILEKQVSPPKYNELKDYPETDSIFYEDDAIHW